jgi:hypothetical protein
MWAKLISSSIALLLGAAACSANIEDSQQVSSTSSGVVQSCKPPLKLVGDSCVGYCPADAPLIVVPPRPTLEYQSGFLAANGLTLNGDSSLVADTGGPCDPSSSSSCLIRLAAAGGAGYGRSSVFGTTAVPVERFYFSTRVKVLPNSAAPADGFTMTLQAVGPQAIGGTGGGLGFGPDPVFATDPVRGARIENSVAIKFDLWSNDGEGTNSTGLYLNGVSPTSAGSIDMTASGIDLHSGNELEITLEHDGEELTQTVRDLVTGNVFSHTYTINVADAIGSTTAYVGFTGATGQASVDITVGEFRFGESNTMTCAASCPPDRSRVGNRCVTDCPPALPYRTLGGVCAASCLSGIHYQGQCILQCPTNAPLLGRDGECRAERSQPSISVAVLKTTTSQPVNLVPFLSSPALGAPPAGAEIAVFLDGTLLATVESGGTVTVPTISEGTHVVRVEYAGNEVALPAVAEQSFFVPGPETTTTVTPSDTTIVAFEEVSFTGLVQFADQAPPGLPQSNLNGSLQFFLDGVSVGSGELNSLETQTVLLNTIGAGTHTVRAVYTSAQPYALPSEGSTTLTVAKADSRVVIAPITSPVPAGESLTLRFSPEPVAPATRGPDLDNDAFLRCTVNGVEQSCAGFDETGPGEYTVTVQFIGDANFNPSPVASVTYTRL